MSSTNVTTLQPRKNAAVPPNETEIKKISSVDKNLLREQKHFNITINYSF